jgi:sugar phosphate isomerase/epimerase
MKIISREHFGYHVVYDVDFYDAIKFAWKHGFGYIVPDLTVPRFVPERFSQSERQRIRKFAKSKEVAISFHAPSDYLNIGTLYPEIKRAVLNRMKLCLDLAKDVEAKRFTIHISPPMDFVFAGRKGTYLQDHWTIYKEAIKHGLIELVEHSNGEVLICVENDSLTKITMEVLDELLQTQNLFLTWDIPKTYTINGELITEIESFLLHHVDRIKECHLHDQKPGKHSHDNLGVGKIDFQRYLKILVPQKVYFTLEIRPREEALKSLKILKSMLRNLGWKISHKS